MKFSCRNDVRIRFLAAVLLAFVGSGIFARQAAAQTVVHVPVDQPNLQAAINAVPDGGIIEMANGTYAAPVGGFSIADRPKTFTIRAAAAATVVLDGGGATDILRFINSSVGAGRPVTFESLIFRNGHTTTIGIVGGVTIQKAKATFRVCRFENNVGASTASAGGGVEVAISSEAYFVDCVFSGNSAYLAGGAMAVETGSKAWIHRGQFLNNRTNLPNHSPTAAGGAIHVGNSVLRVSNSRFDSNEAGYVAGAVYAIGTWLDPVATPQSDVVISNCTFVNNKAARDPSVSSVGPTEGGAVHFEDQTTARVFNSRFVTNSADTGGALNLYRAIVTVKGCVFQGNRAVGATTGFGGAMNALSNDVSDASTGFGSINRRAASLTVSDTVIQGRFGAVSTVGQIGGGIFASGDADSMYGLYGMLQNGTAAQNRATLNLTNVAIYDCEVVGSGVGGGLVTDLAAVTASDVLFARLYAGRFTTTGSGGAIAALDQSSLSLMSALVSASIAGRYGGGLFVQGSQVAISLSSIAENALDTVGANASVSYGAGMFSAPDDGRNVAASGTVASTLFSHNTGLPVFDDDRAAGPINDVRYNGNSIYSTTFGAQVYSDAVPGFCCKTVPQLNSLTVTRTSAPSTVKSTVANTSLGAAPEVGLLKALPPLVLAQGASGDPAGATTSYLVYGWSGGAAQLNGSPVSGFAGLTPAAGTGSNLLAVGSSTFPATVLAGATPSGSLLAAPNPISPGGTSLLSWSSPLGTFLDSAVDQGVGFVSTASGSSTVTPPDTTKYTFFQISEEGGAAATTTVSVQPSPPAISSFTASPLVIRTGQGSLLSWGTSGATSVTLNASGVAANGSQTVFPSVTTTYTLVATNSLGSATQAVTVNVDVGTGPLGSPAITAPGSGQVLGLAGVTVVWSPVGGATGYDMRLWDGTSGATVFAGSLVGSGSTSTLVTLPQTNGSYVVGVRACAGGSFTDAACGIYATRSFSVNLITPTGVPTVTLPTNGSTLTASTQTLAWTAVAKADPSLTLSYEVLLTDIAGGNKSELQITVPDPGLSTIYSMHSSSQYELKVRACQGGCGQWSTPVTFAVSLPAVPTGAPGITGCTVTGGNSLTCNWNAVARADLYQIYVVQPPPAGPGGGALTVAAKVVSETTVTLPVPLGVANVIVAACNGDGCGPFGASVGINPAGPNPSVASLGAPLGGSIVSGPMVVFSWNRIPGDNGTNTVYRLFVQDLSRQSTALDVYTTQNFWGAYFKAEGARYDALVIANPGPSQVVGPAQGFNVSGTSASAPTMVSPGHQSSVQAGNVQLGWTPVLGAGLYQYYIAAQVAGGPVVTGVTPGLVVQVPLGTVAGVPTPYSGITRACPSGVTCTAASDTGWGPWSNAPGGPGVTNFTVTP